MTKTEFMDTPPELQENIDKALQTGDPFVKSNIIKHATKQGTMKSQATSGRSMIRQCADFWNAFDPGTKAPWKTYCPYTRKNGWNHFVADECKRIKAGLGGTATPHEDYQVMIGQIDIEAPATGITLVQPHFNNYKIKGKVPGYQRKYRPFDVNEFLIRPFTLAITYKSDLTASGGDPVAKFYAKVRHDYQGQTMYYDHVINLGLQEDWTRPEVELPVLLGRIKSYDLYIEIINCRGTLKIDNMEAIHCSQNWAIDRQFQEMNPHYPKSLSTCQRPWNELDVPTGASYNSKYHS